MAAKIPSFKEHLRGLGSWLKSLIVVRKSGLLCVLDLYTVWYPVFVAITSCDSHNKLELGVARLI